MANSTRKCKHCSEYKPAESGVKVPAGWFCCHQHAIEFARAKSARNFEIEQRRRSADAKRSRNAARNALRQRGLAVKPLSYWMKKAQVAVNKYIRLRDSGLPCISCGRSASWHGQWHASHFRSVGSASSLRFNTKNIHKACSICNTHLSGSIMNYRPALIEKIGYNAVEALEKNNSISRYSVDYLKRIEVVFTRKSKRIIGRLEV